MSVSTGSMTTSRDQRAEPFGLTAPAFSLLSLLVLVLAALIAALLQRADVLRQFGFSGTSVPDAESLTLTTRLFWQNPGWLTQQLWTYLGVLIVYGVAVVQHSTALLLTINVIILWLAAHVFAAALTVDVGPHRARAMALGGVVIVGTNVYILEVLAFANKEVPLILLTNCVVYLAVYRQQIVGAILVAASAYIFRDGYSIVLIAALGLTVVRDLLGRSTVLIVLAVITALLALLPASEIASLDPAIMRNVGIGEVMVGDKFESAVPGLSYMTRLAGTALNLGFRPQVFDTHFDFYLLGFGFWQIGVLIITGTVAAAVTLADKSKGGQVALIVIVTLLGISYSTFVQPRYMMPLIFWLFALTTRLGRWRWPIVLLCMVAPLGFASMSALPPLAVS